MNTNNFSWINSWKSNWFIKYFLFFCKKVGAPKDLYDKIESLNESNWDYNWPSFFSIFLWILDQHNQDLNWKNTKLDTTKNYENSLYFLWLNLIKWYLNYLNTSLDFLKNQPMKISTSEIILDLEDEINEVISILEEENANNDWIWLRNHIDLLQSRLSKISLEINSYNQRKKDVVSITRQRAWEAFISSWKVKNQDIYFIQKKLDLPLSETTKDLVLWVKSNFNNVVWIDSLNLNDKKVLSAIKSVQAREKDKATDFSIYLRNDLHKKFWAAANDELFYTSFLDIDSSKDESDIISLDIVWYDTFNIISHQSINWSNKSKFKIQYKLLWNDKLIETELYCDPSKLVSWQQSRVWLIQDNWTIKIELLNINKIYNSWVLIKRDIKKSEEKQWFFAKTKNFISNKISSFLNKKVA